MGRYVFFVDLDKIAYKTIILPHKTIEYIPRDELLTLPFVASPIPDPIVQCKDCIYYQESKHLAPIKFCFRLKDRKGKPVGYNFAKDDFCSRGRKKEDGNGNNEVPQQEE